MSDPSSQCRMALFVLVLMIALVATGGCGGGPESPTAPAISSGGGGSGTGGGSGGSGGTGGGGGEPPPTQPAVTSGGLSIFLTDAPIEVHELQVYIEGLKVKPAGGPVERFASTIGLVDLLTLQGGITELLGRDEVEAGTYQFIELLLDEDLSYVVEAEGEDPLPVKIPSEKIKIKGGSFEVLADGMTSVVVDFDAEKSLKKTGKGRYQLKPFVSIVKVTSSTG